MSHYHPKTQWEDEVVYHDGDLFFQELLEQIAQAKKTIKIETYIFDRDVLGLKMLNALSLAATRGVSVKLLLDGLGCSSWSFEDAERYRSEHFQIRFFHPLLWQRKFSRIWTYLNINKIIRGLSLLNHRNHRKLFLIDETAFIGSMNVSSRHLKSFQNHLAWRDTSVRVKGNLLSVLHESFNESWNEYQNYLFRYLLRSKPTSGFPILMLNRTMKQRKQCYRHLLHKITSAKNTIRITTPYFIPTTKLKRSLKDAVRNGIEVILLFPGQSDVKAVKIAMEGHYQSLLKAGIRIFEYQPSMLHAKVLITDDKVMIGSTNMNSRSLYLDLEVDLEITHEDNREIIRRQFERDLGHSREIRLEEWKKRAWPRKVLESVLFWFRMVL